jgi:FlaA1/EpsC-like NDP-sugar epimerase
MKAIIKPRIDHLNQQARRVPRRHRQLALIELLLAAVFLIFALYNTVISPLVSEKLVFALMSVALLIISMSYLFTFIDAFYDRRAAHRS